MPCHVLWISGSKMVVYRGKNYVKPVVEQQLRTSHAELEELFEGKQEDAVDEVGRLSAGKSMQQVAAGEPEPARV